MSADVGFDSSVLSPFARARRLDVLEQLTAGRRRVVTRAVLDEIERGRALYPALGEVAALSWLTPVPVDSLDELIAFSTYLRILGSDARNVGESSVLAWAEVRSGVALVDDQAAVNAAKARHVTTRRSLALVCDGLRKQVITITQARSLVDELVAAGARFPCDGAGFEAWAELNGLVS